MSFLDVFSLRRLAVPYENLGGYELIMDLLVIWVLWSLNQNQTKNTCKTKVY